MSTLLIGCWSKDGTVLSITASHQVADGDQAALNALTRPAFANGANWACEFDVDNHRHAVQRAYEEFARDDDTWVDDTVDHFEPV
ncbi:hypothetical protein [Streptomyces lavenduligriseus]|uniref:Uncharacterized protein n=1 Tax=Streptomyces lavenduligriseus TaxID=67315 RepID=A0ABT0P5H4_9ACTN|nr:hypothetical protein [Streptomyces lavenduligriseus]MCL3998975.1 hypothetical protein [Streptomyces lavenduligriseus]